MIVFPIAIFSCTDAVRSGGRERIRFGQGWSFSGGYDEGEMKMEFSVPVKECLQY